MWGLFQALSKASGALFNPEVNGPSAERLSCICSSPPFSLLCSLSGILSSYIGPPGLILKLSHLGYFPPSIFHLPKFDEIVLSCPPLLFSLFLYPCCFVLFNPFTIILVEYEEQAEKIKAGLATGTPTAIFTLFFFFHFPCSFHCETFK